MKKSNQLLNRSNKELSEFNRILSHDLKEPLRSIVGFSQLANRSVKDNPKAQEYLQFVMASGGQLQEIIESINIFQKTNTINTKLISPIKIQSLLDDICLSIEEKYPNKKINLSGNIDLTIQNSQETVRSIFQIILDNAAKYNEQETVQVTVNAYSKNKILFEVL